ncbi:hypothetical protein [Lentilactobacillus sp. SPB1-3]|uniref:Uncharacterized protein n=1 Tax=Lentilactobacillus terminaliae TaxID=3003483 RepID=A0ACD5DDU8_9LACO|nr:hypothetical protein [Lentilactobacillus sp. SPB1-3]MCZ0978124.1 hypothetical protein [Lentilactobacillus sp. SPB1-3]
MSNDDLQNGQTFNDFHRENITKFVGFRSNIQGTEFDKFHKFIDSLVFTEHQNLDERDRAYDIDYASGLELDDIGDDFDIERNGLDDENYRFLLKSHSLSVNSDGTWRTIKQNAAALLGCDPEDVDIVRSRQLKDGVLQGDPNTIEIVDIDVTKITHGNLLTKIADELQKSMTAGYTIKQLGFAASASVQTYVGVGMSGHAEATFDIPPYVEVKKNIKANTYIGVGIKFDYYVQI